MEFRFENNDLNFSFSLLRKLKALLCKNTSKTSFSQATYIFPKISTVITKFNIIFIILLYLFNRYVIDKLLCSSQAVPAACSGEPGGAGVRYL